MRRLKRVKTFSYDGGNLTGNRGFRANGNGLYGDEITLTSYIWEYLGNTCPVSICGGGLTGSALSGMTSVGIEWD